MTDLIQLDDVEIAAVAGGVQTNTITQTNTSTATQTAPATNSGAVTASITGGGAGATVAAVGASATNTVLVYQSNRARASNSVRFDF